MSKRAAKAPETDTVVEGTTTKPVQPVTPTGKLGVLVELLRQPGGTTIQAMAEATDWQTHSVRGALAGALRKRGFVVCSEKPDRVRLYRIDPDPQAAAAAAPAAVSNDQGRPTL